MKKLLFILLLLTIVGCEYSIKPIEKYKGGIVVQRGTNYTTDIEPYIRIKSKDSIFWTKVIRYDADRFNIGDTIK